MSSSNNAILSSVYPSVGELYGNTTIDISGNNFQGTTNVWFIDSNSITYDASFTYINSNHITAKTPYSLTPQVMQIYLNNPNGISTQSLSFTFKDQCRLYGLYYVVGASGSFYIEEQFPSVSLIQEASLNRYDVTNALQVAYDVRKFNQLVGIIKDASNHYVVATEYDSQISSFPNDSITLDASFFVNYMSHDQVISVGTYSTLYSDFDTYVNRYFNYGGFTPLVNGVYGSSQFYDLYSGVFDASSFMHIITEYAIDSSNAYVNAVTGSITINGVNRVLSSMTSTNPYHNRNPVGEPFSTPSDDISYKVQDGFVDGDLVYVPAGTSVTLKLDVQRISTNYSTYASSNTFNDNGLCNYSSKYSDTDYTSNMETDFSNNRVIKQTLTAPLLIHLKNLSIDPYKYGNIGGSGPV